MAASTDTIQAPPKTSLRTLVHIGPGLVLAGSIVGSGELIATTTTGARAGFTLLWLVLIGCLIKVFAQIELGRAAVSRGCTALGALDELPGPRLPFLAGRAVSWGVWCWIAMLLLTLAQQGGIVGGVASTLAQSQPWSEAGAQYQALADEVTRLEVEAVLVGETAEQATQLEQARQNLAQAAPHSDELWWGGLVTLVTCVLLAGGRYRLIQALAAVTVGSFTALTVLTVVLLQRQPDWAVRAAELWEGLSFRLPPPDRATAPLSTALATFGMIGVGAAELIAYPYWCLDKGYALRTGPDDGSPGWLERAQGWLRVMRWDAWFSAGVYTFATLAFYLLGAAVLGRSGFDPGRQDLIRTLGWMYQPVFGEVARPIFLVGAFCVLYSTFFVAAAGAARVAADALIQLGWVQEAGRVAWVGRLSVLFPLLSYGVYAGVRAPLGLVLAGGISQALMLPVLAAVALHQRYRRTDDRLKPGQFWDIALWISSAGLVLAGGWTMADRIL